MLGGRLWELSVGSKSLPGSGGQDGDYVDAGTLPAMEVLCSQQLPSLFSHVKSKNDQFPHLIPNAGKASPILIRI